MVAATKLKGIGRRVVELPSAWAMARRRNSAGGAHGSAVARLSRR
ncbi:MAG: hypothetical protein M0Z69_15465 [Actinomycetota bacterium]|nr:hypothetical protein [Actinomycetota bacterium]